MSVDCRDARVLAGSFLLSYPWLKATNAGGLGAEPPRSCRIRCITAGARTLTHARIAGAGMDSRVKLEFVSETTADRREERRPRLDRWVGR